jgi:hypothetical protein
LLWETTGRTPVLKPIDLSKEADLKAFIDVLVEKVSAPTG